MRQTTRLLAIAILPFLAVAGPLDAPAGAQTISAPLDPFAAVVAKVSPAVVRIAVSQTPTPGPSGNQQVASNPSMARAADEAESQMFAIGSGFIIDPSGYIATNKHVVENALAITVIDTKGERFPARIVGMTSRADMALLKINAGRPLPTVPFGDSDAMHVGDPVIAIGSPFGFDNTVTNGIISAVNRDIMESPFDDYFQTDAAINHGNSGGPLFNMRGQVVGMNSVIIAPGTGFAGLAFSIPSNDLKFVFDRLIHTGKIDCGMLPITTQAVTWPLKQALGAPDLRGALVSAVNDPKGTMLNGLIQSGDVIVSFNGQPISDPRELARKAAWSPVGSEVELGVNRGGQVHSVKVKIHEWPESPMPVTMRPDRPLGLTLSSRPSAEGPSTVVVASVDPNGTAADSGIRPGDTIVKVQHVAITTPEQATDLMNQRAGQKDPYSAVLVERAQKQMWLAVSLPAK
ncbi:MAG TPA: trypsin-like peptidase domain-containing protein [Rhodopila sp.]|uniref:trypsin-like peptidase domain-containing protein n=1 Tax=Rhodopila sp. TaxID=2480087 RepID=UPI002BBF5F1A|nr:trypsin-like peptidase domain-containing protein [Rhodopila sp.]HVY14977.1 trypsin-like peptidase domain-containing protein [Rhodopila sp.]